MRTSGATKQGLILAALFMLWNGGCSGGDDDDGSPADSPVEDSPTPTLEPSPEPGTPTPGPTGTPAGTETPGATATPGPTATPLPTPPVDSPTPGITPTPVADVDQDGFTAAEGDCDDANASVYPEADEVPYDDVDQDCSGGDLVDVDDDGQAALEADGPDCDDADETIYAGAKEVAYDGVDQSCDGEDLTDVDGDGVDASEAGGADCDDADLNSYPGAAEYADGEDNDCDGKIDEDLSTSDDDGDGYAEASGDCNDGDPAIHPGVAEVPYDGIDQDCSGLDLADVDGDGADSDQVSGGTDCEDADADIHPDAEEICDAVDNDCDGVVDSDAVDRTVYYTDGDGDGYGDPAKAISVCAPSAGQVSDHTDCDDSRAAVHPGATETCNGLDDDCDTQVDEGVTSTYYLDADEDGYGNPAKSTQACSAPAGYVSDNTDCKDSNDDIHPGAAEACNGVDDDCDGQVDDGAKTTWYQDADKDGYGNPASSTQACSAPTGYVADSRDCNDANAAVYPGAAEACNSVDDDCDGSTDEGVTSTFYADADGDGYGNPASSTQACSAPSGYVAGNTDCDDASASIYPQAAEVCNGADDDCDRQVDDGVKSTFYVDADGDGYGSVSSSTQACSAPSGYVASGTDCKDSDASIHPGASETCNGIDDDCDTVADEGVKSTYYLDVDKDGYGGDTTLEACSAPSGYVSNSDDCDDQSASVYPGAAEGANGVDDDCDGSVDEGVIFPSCREIKAASPSSASGLYYVDPDGVGGNAAFQAYCDMSADGGGWTLAVNIKSDLGAINLYTYNNRSSDPLGTNYGVYMAAFSLNTSTSYRLNCIESSDSTTRKMFIKGLSPAEPIFQAAGTITKTNLMCSQSPDYSSPQTGTNCILGGYEDDNHTYYGNPAWDMDWAMYKLGSAYTLRHCANRGNGYFNQGQLWFR